MNKAVQILALSVSFSLIACSVHNSTAHHHHHSKERKFRLDRQKKCMVIKALENTLRAAINSIKA